MDRRGKTEKGGKAKGKRLKAHISLKEGGREYGILLMAKCKKLKAKGKCLKPNGH